MYAIIRAGGKQAKVHEGDVLDVERIKGTGEVSFTPLLIVADDGSVISDRDALGKATVTAEVLGASAGPKVDIFKYKAKTGYRRRQGHRQKYTTIKVTKIATTASAPKKATKKSATPKDETPEETRSAKAATPDEATGETTTKKPAAKKPAAKNPAAKKQAAKKPAAKKPAAKAEATADTTEEE